MRQKDVDQLTTIWAGDIEQADACELAGYEAAIGAIIKPLVYVSDPNHPLDVSGLQALCDRAQQRQREVGR